MGGRSRDRGAEQRAEEAKKETEAVKVKYEKEKEDIQRVGAEEAAGRMRSRRSRSSLLSSARLGAADETLGATKV
jgi:hypothetical protein